MVTFGFRHICGVLNAPFIVTFCVMLSLKILLTEGRVKTNTEVYCTGILGQQHYSLSDMTGAWYGIEILEHVNKNRPTADSCIRVELKDHGSNNVELIWRERKFEVTYAFVILDPGSRGIWTSQGSQTVRGNLVYEQFAGNVFVLKASDTNVVLTFCSSPHVLYTLVLSKTHIMNETELASIHSMVQRFGVPSPVDIKKYCKNNASVIDSAALLLVLLLTTVFTLTLRA